MMHNEESQAKKKMVIINQEGNSAVSDNNNVGSTNPAERPDDWVFTGCTLLFVCMDAPFSLKKIMIVLLTLQQELKLKVHIILQERLLINKMLIIGTKLVLLNQLHLEIDDGHRS
jgi:hypothetical protein